MDNNIDRVNLVNERIDKIKPQKLNVTEFNKTHLQLIAGAVSETVGYTLGPMGRNVLLANGTTEVMESTKDGKDVLSNIKVTNGVEKRLIESLTLASANVLAESGDGTTTALIFVAEFIKVLSESIDNYEEKLGRTIPALVLDNFLETFKPLFSSLLFDNKKDITSMDDYVNILKVSLNNNMQLVGVIRDALEEVLIKEGRHYDQVTLCYEPSVTGKFKSVFSNGYKIENKTKVISHKKEGVPTTILMVANGINGHLVASEICDVIDDFHKCEEKAGEHLLILSYEVSQSARMIIDKHINKNYFKNNLDCRVLINEINSSVVDPIVLFEDLRILTNSVPREIHEDMVAEGMKYDTLPSTKINIDKYSLVISAVYPDMNGQTPCNAKLDALVEDIQKQLTDPILGQKKRTSLSYRASILKNAVVTIYVGGTDRMDIARNKSQLDDATKAVEAALDGGFVAGGCSAIYKASLELKGYFKGELPVDGDSNTYKAIELVDAVTKELIHIGIYQQVVIDSKGLVLDAIEKASLNVMGHITASAGVDVESVKDIIGDLDSYQSTFNIMTGAKSEGIVINPVKTDVSIIRSALSCYKNLVIPKVIVHEDENEALAYISRIKSVFRTM